MSYQTALTRLEDEDVMPFGMHKGREMRDVPASYLHWLWTEKRLKWDGNSPVGKYIRGSLQALKDEEPDLIWD